MILGVTPARGGSKGIREKNIRIIAGRPLIAFAIEVGLATRLIDRYIVSTDSKEIARIAVSLGATVPFERPAIIATDSAPMLPVLKHAVVEIEQQTGDVVEAVVLLDPTAPLRTVEDVENAIKLFQQGECDAVISVNKSAKNPYFNMVEIRNGYCNLVKPIDPPVTRRQDAPEVFEMNTVVSIFSKKVVMNAKQRIPKKTRYLMIPRERSIDIDTPYDLQRLDFLLSNASRLQQ